MLAYVMGLVLLGAEPNLAANGGFDDGLNGWKPNTPQVPMEAIDDEGRSVARVSVPAETPLGYPGLYQEMVVQPGQILEFRADLRTRGVRDGFGAYIALEFHKSGTGRLTYSQSEGLTGDSGWIERVVRTVVPPEADRARMVLLINGHGEAFFDNARLTTAGSTAAGPLSGPVTLSVTGDVVCNDLVGFGFEDDGWFYNPVNAAKGVTPEDYPIREGRIEWMKPDHVRMFFWIKDFCPSGDWETFTFDSPNMQSRYRSLDTYQRIGTEINVTDVEWDVKGPYDDPAKAARGIATLLEHLIRDRGYTCIKYWTLTNEPNTGWYRQWSGTLEPFEGFVQVHRLVKEELRKRQLPVKVVGSDDTAGFDWFERCAQNPAYFETADLFASHRYCQYPDRDLASFFFRERLDLLASKTPKKPLVIEEFGFQDERSGTLENPIMRTYPYAIWTSAFCIEGLNMGVAGFSIWSIHEMYYPGAIMEYALWDFKYDDWKVRPVYHAIANFTRFTERGDKVYRCDSSSPAHVIGSRVGDTLFWVNRSDVPAEVVIAGFSPKEVRIQTEQTLQGDRDSGTVEPLNDGRFKAPPQSFGYAR